MTPPLLAPKQWMLLAAAIFLFLAVRGRGDNPPPRAPESPFRYEIVTTDSVAVVLMIDRQTGKVWRYDIAHDEKIGSVSHTYPEHFRRVFVDDVDGSYFDFDRDPADWQINGHAFVKNSYNTKK